MGKTRETQRKGEDNEELYHYERNRVTLSDNGLVIMLTSLILHGNMGYCEVYILQLNSSLRVSSRKSGEYLSSERNRK